MTNPFNSIQSQQRPTVNPFDSVGGVNPFDGAASSRAPVAEDDPPNVLERAGSAALQLVTHPVDAITGMAKAVLFDALKATVAPIRLPGGRVLGAPPADIAGRLPNVFNEPITPGQYGGALLRTASIGAGGAITKALGPVAAGAGIGALQAPDDPGVGAILGGGFGVLGKTAGEIGRRAGLKRVAKSGAPVPEAKPTVTPEPVEPPPRSAIRDMSNQEVLDMTPEGIKIVAKQAAKEERALYTELFGPKGARQYRKMLRASTSAESSPEAAAQALAGLQRMYGELTPAQQTALDQIQSKGFTSKRLAKIAELTKDYTPENLAKVADEDLVRQFGEVLMSNKPDRNLAGLYRLRSVYSELEGRGMQATDILRGVYNYMLGQGVKPERLGQTILSKMSDVRKTLAKVDPERVTPETPPQAPTSTPSQPLGPISEQQFQQELAAITPPAVAPVDDAAARVQAARTTPFPDIQNPISGGAVENPTPWIPVPEGGLTPEDIAYRREIAAEELARTQRGETGLIGTNANDVLQADAGPNLKTQAQEINLVQEALKQSQSGAVESVKNFVKDDAGKLDVQALTDPLQTKPDMASLQPHSRAIQEQIETGYKPAQENPLRPIEGLYAALVRRTAPLERLEKSVAKSTGKQIPVRELPSAAVQLLAGWAGPAQHFLEFGPIRWQNGLPVPTGTKGLKQIFKEAGDINAWRRQLIAQRVVELDAAGRKVETGINPADARQEIANANPRTAQAVADTHRYLDDVLQYAIDSDLLDSGLANWLRQLGQAYVPLDRVLKRGTKNAGNIQYSALSTPQAFRQLLGSKLKIADPAFTITDNTRRVIRAAELNEVGKTIVDFAAAFPNETKGWLVREKNVTASNAPNIVATGQGIQQIAKKLGINLDLNTAKQIGSILGDSNLLVEGDIMRVRVGGEIQQYRVAPELGKVLRSIGPQQLPLWMRLVGLPTQALKVGVTANPFFGAYQAFVGAFQSKIQSKYGFRITQDPFEGLYKRVKKSPEFREALAAGGTSAFLSATGRSTEAALRSITPGNFAQKTIRAIAHPLEALRAVAEPLEEMNRLGEYIRARKQGADVFEAALAMREVDTDFSMIGTQMAGLAHMVAFLNPFLQAGDKFAKTLSKSPAPWVAGVMGVTVPSIALWMAADGDKQVRDLQRSQAGIRNWFMRLPKTGEIVKIPKPYLYGEVFAGTTEAVLNQMETDSPEQYATLAQGMKDNFTFLMMPTVAQTYIGVSQNKNLLTGSDIVPESRAGLDPRLQYTNQTTETARFVGDKLGISPAKIDFAIQSLGGTLAEEGIRSLDALIPNGPATPPAPVSADLPLVGRFFAMYPSESVEPIRTFYKNATESQMRLATVRKYVDLQDEARATAYLEKHKDAIALADAYGQVRQEFTKKRTLLDQIRNVPDNVMTPQTKRELTDQILEGMIESARAVNDAVRSQRKAAKEVIAGGR